MWCALLLLLVGGCTPRTVHLTLVDFASGDVDGIWLWRQQANGEYARRCLFALSDPDLQSGVEVLYYVRICEGDAAPSSPMQAEIARNAGVPDRVTLRLEYRSGSATIGTYRASAFNDSGESALSSESVRL